MPKVTNLPGPDQSIRPCLEYDAMLETSNKPLQGTERCTIADNVSRTDKVPTKFVSSD